MLRHFILSLVLCGQCAAWAHEPAKWLSGETVEPTKPAPFIFKSFALAEKPRSATLTVTFAGWGEVYINGAKVGHDVLTPVTCQPDKRLSSLTYEVAPYLKAGTNEVGFLLGNGWFNPFTLSDWGFSQAPWRACPQVRAELRVAGEVCLTTDRSWQVVDSPIVFNSLRNGEWYDARLEGRRTPTRRAHVMMFVPSGCVSPEDAVPCRVCETLLPKRTLRTPTGDAVYDFGANIAGWCEIDVAGEAGAKVTLDYDECLTPSNTPLGYIAIYIRKQGDPFPVQHDEYTLAGKDAGESWHPRFTYHGFRYVRVALRGKVAVRAIRARFVHSDFAEAGHLETSDPTFTALQDATRRSYLSNFTGIPTDCPHREKNGWTGDAQLAAETGLWNYDSADGYRHFLRMMLDAQQPNGAVPCILPHSPTFGLKWGSGPAWDAVLFEIPEQLYRFRGDASAAREAYPAMKRYLSFMFAKADADGLFRYGLGDWCDVGRQRRTDVRLTTSAFVYRFCRRLTKWARHFGDGLTADAAEAHAEAIRTAFNRVFYKGDGLYAGGSWTELAAPLYFKGLCADGEEQKVVRRLVEAVRANGHKVAFGILGAKWVPRVLADYGYADDAFRLFVQPDAPGWANWLKSGDGTLHENWESDTSHNHIMYGDLSAWAYEYAVGIVPCAPGFRKVAFRPHYLTGVDSFSATYQTPHGEIRAGWQRRDGKPVFTYAVPKGVEVVEAPSVCP